MLLILKIRFLTMFTLLNFRFCDKIITFVFSSRYVLPSIVGSKEFEHILRKVAVHRINFKRFVYLLSIGVP